ncbi:DUF4845 domain-containing protein [Marinobacterium stanieri]|uniref:DUF4845 domain-containing protein n=1 Tax=Marinobacterium stanieri TaxID=49186 RepID=A0A1N6SLR5_9GAMM|nr:DUF4845 domain-containing protein [Marinobacterium stanieri]SIQ42021.1 protein of unknown function [Marinobacterium stanieri]
MNTGVAQYQRGASFLSIIIGLIIAGFFFSVAFKLFTPYKDHATIDSVLTSLTEDPKQVDLPNSTIRSNIEKRFVINQVKLPSREALEIRQEEGTVYLDLNYEVRVPMFYNVDAVVKFEEHYEAVKP